MRIVLDAGHGMNTPGKRSPDGMREFEFNVAVATYMRDELEKYKDVDMIFVHDHPNGKRDVPLKERTDRANKWGADVYFSIHANALAGKMGNHGGIETYAYTTKPKGSTALAKKVQAELVKETGLRNRGVKFANFHVLRETKMTAVLVEHGFMDSKTDLPKLKSDQFRKECAKANVRALADFFNLKKKPQKKPKASDGEFYRVITGSFKNKENAEQRVKELKAKGFDSFISKEDV